MWHTLTDSIVNCQKGTVRFQCVLHRQAKALRCGEEGAYLAGG